METLVEVAENELDNRVIWTEPSDIVRGLHWRTLTLRQMLVDGGYRYASRAPGELGAQIGVLIDDLDGPLQRCDYG